MIFLLMKSEDIDGKEYRLQKIKEEFTQVQFWFHY